MYIRYTSMCSFFFFQAEDGIRDVAVTGVQTCALPILAIAGAVCGGFLAAALSRFLVAFISTAGNPVFLDMPTDWRVLGFSGALAVLTTLLFALAPALPAPNVPPGAQRGRKSEQIGRAHV